MAKDLERYLISKYHRWNLSLRYTQRFSMRFMSKELSDHFIIINPCSLAVFLSQSQVKLAIWDLALSCWNVISHRSFALNASMNSRRYWSRMAIYYSFLIESSINAISSNLLPIKHSHTICDNCLISLFCHYILWHIFLHFILMPPYPYSANVIILLNCGLIRSYNHSPILYRPMSMCPCLL